MKTYCENYKDWYLELEMLAALRTTEYCKDRKIIEWKFENNNEIYTEEAQLVFNIQILNLNKERKYEGRIAERKTSIS